EFLVPSTAGLHLCALGVSVRPAPDLAVEPLEAYCGTSPPRTGLVLGYGAIGTDALPEGLRLLSSRLSARP
ncbi:PLP-dependent aminotransferase family protein, partial [Nonomuraea sp. NPDC004297]